MLLLLMCISFLINYGSGIQNRIIPGKFDATKINSGKFTFLEEQIWFFDRKFICKKKCLGIEE